MPTTDFYNNIFFATETRHRASFFNKCYRQPPPNGKHWFMSGILPLLEQLTSLNIKAHQSVLPLTLFSTIPQPRHLFHLSVSVSTSPHLSYKTSGNKGWSFSTRYVPGTVLSTLGGQIHLILNNLMWYTIFISI